MPDGVFVKDLDLIDAFAKYSDPMLKENLSYLQQLRQGSRGYYFGEYLSQGYLGIDGICSQATMQDLIGSGLFELMPEFEDQASWNLWANRVIQLRDPFRGGTIGITPSHDYEVRRAILIAETCFPGRWALPTAVMLLSLKPRMNKDRVILDAFAAMYSEEEVRRLSFQDIKIDARRLPEDKQFAKLLDDIQVHILGEDINLLLDPFTMLG
ncbi:hypothetical protein IQ06DRAFT_220781 [Phaeosphaeriaceae sp. SRC1lsM3a]|nr:hypothetical protein IQ06DRAFT_220781 [Stagonospora sp. SRC1lsM3a]